MGMVSVGGVDMMGVVDLGKCIHHSITPLLLHIPYINLFIHTLFCTYIQSLHT